MTHKLLRFCLQSRQAPRSTGGGRAGSHFRWQVLTLLFLTAAAVVALAGPANAAPSQWIEEEAQLAGKIDFTDSDNGWVFSAVGCVIAHTADGGATWVRQYLLAAGHLNDGDFADSLHGWAVGRDGLILATSDGGATWTQQASGTKNDLRAVAFTDASNGWAVGTNGCILHTADGGATWQPQSSDGLLWSLRDVAFSDSLHGCAVGEAFGAVFTTDGGAHWTQSSTGMATSYAIAFTGASSAIATGNAGGMARTTDCGATWTPVASGSGVDLADVAFLDGRLGWACGTGTFLFTSDGGGSWSQERGPDPLGGHDIAPVDINTVFVAAGDSVYRSTHGGIAGASGWTIQLPTDVPQGSGPAGVDIDMTSLSAGWALGGASGTVLHTSDGGATWTARTTGSSGGLADVYALDGQNAWAVGIWGDIMRTVDGGLTWSQQGQLGWQVQAVACADASHGCAVGWSGLTLRTTDGNSWTRQTSGTTKNLRSVSSPDSEYSWAVGDQGTIIRTTNGGRSWSVQKSGTREDLRDVAFVDDKRGCAVGDKGSVLTTTDGGTTWRARTSGITASLYEVTFADAKHGWISGSDGALLVTSDGGAHWTTQVAIGSFEGIDAVDPLHAWATSGGGICATDNGGLPPAPQTSATGLSASDRTGWHRTSSTVSLSAAAGNDPAAPKATYYRIDGGPALTYAAPFRIKGRGVHHIEYWSADSQNRMEAVRTGYVNIDDLGARCIALNNVTARRGARATLLFSIDDPDPSCGFANVTIRITRNGKLVKVLRKAKVATSTNRTISFRASLPAGKYKWTVSAVDIVGNPATKKTSRSLTVK